MRRVLVAAVALLVLVAAGCQSGSTSSATLATGRTDASTSVPSSAQTSPDVPALLAKVRPSVVTVTTKLSQPGSLLQTGASAAAGSGFVFDSSGLVLTNHHVVANASRIVVGFVDGKHYTATVVGSDARTDLAVLRIHASGLHALHLATTPPVVGAPVVAIGNALALPGGPTVTSGIVSAVDRTIQEPDGAVLTHLLQTDAAINPGNSGGPLLNGDGTVVGVNTAKASGATGIGFAISVANAKDDIRQLVQTGKVVHPYLGVEIVDVTPQVASQYGLSVQQGALVARVVPNGPAAAAGVQTGDVITAIDGQQVSSTAALQKAVDAHQPGQQVQVRLATGSGTRTVAITLGTAPPSGS